MAVKGEERTDDNSGGGRRGDDDRGDDDGGRLWWRPSGSDNSSKYTLTTPAKTAKTSYRNRTRSDVTLKPDKGFRAGGFKASGLCRDHVESPTPPLSI